ncbi:MAG: hypothetical protein V7L27_26320 [Nostoc sp.]
MLNEIITIYAITDDLLKAIGHDEDCRRGMSREFHSPGQVCFYLPTRQLIYAPQFASVIN